MPWHDLALLYTGLYFQQRYIPLTYKDEALSLYHHNHEATRLPRSTIDSSRKSTDYLLRSFAVSLIPTHWIMPIETDHYEQIYAFSIFMRLWLLAMKFTRTAAPPFGFARMTWSGQGNQAEREISRINCVFSSYCISSYPWSIDNALIQNIDGVSKNWSRTSYHKIAINNHCWSTMRHELNI